MASAKNASVTSVAAIALILLTAASGGVAVTGSADLFVDGGRLEASDYVSVSGSADLIIKNNNLAAYGVVTVNPPSSGVVLDLQPKLYPSAIAASVTAGENQLVNELVMAVEGDVEVTASQCFIRGRQAIGFCDLVDEVLWLWGIQNTDTVDKHIREKAVNDINNAIQFLWSQAKQIDYWSRSTITINFTASSSSQTLDDNIQNVVGSVRLANGQPLSPLQTRGEYDNYGMFYLGQSSRVVQDGTPEAYYLERLNQDSLDPVRVNLHLVPAPAIDTDIIMDVVTEAPRYTWGDYRSCSNVPVPHRYTESILLPIIRHRAMSFYLFIKPERAEMIQQEYSTAMAQLGINDPIQGKEVANDNG